jgi:HSP20 family protein
MATLIRWSPMTDLMDLGWNIDRFFRDLMEPAEFSEGGYCISPPVESFRHNGSFVVRVDLPGVNPQDVHLTADQASLTIEGERKRSSEIGEDSLFRDELCYGSFRRSVEIPDGVKTDQIKAKYHDGVLEITAPVGEENLPKKIEVEIQKS